MATKLYDASWVAETIDRLADEILANRMPGAPRAVIGVRTRGAVIAERLARRLGELGQLPLLGFLDATFFRDDLHTGAGLKAVKATEIAFDLNGKAVILVDDVLATGRTVRAAIDALFSFGRPACVRLCAMLDRGGRELPIQPDFTGARVDVPKGGFVRLRLTESDKRDAVYVVGPGDEEPE